MPKPAVVAVVIGTRPEAIKMAPVMMALRSRANRIRPLLISTGQHVEMLAQGLDIFGLAPDVALDVMRPGQSLAQLSGRLFTAMDEALEREKPDMLLVQGDTTTTLVASLVAYYRQIPIGHVEAGLRTNDKRNPFPEEVNRRLVGHVTDLHFVPTEAARRNLLREGIEASTIFLTGNTVVDALHFASRAIRDQSHLDAETKAWLDPAARLLLVTAHRRENFGRGLDEICGALREIALRFADEVQLIFPVHMNPQVQGRVHGELAGISNLRLVNPLNYPSFVELLQRCHLVLTDSGGIQEEAPTFGKPVLIMRERTERGEGVEAGCAKLVGTTADAIVRAAATLLQSDHEYTRMAVASSPYGDGSAAERIAELVEGYVSRNYAPARTFPLGSAHPMGAVGLGLHP